MPGSGAIETALAEGLARLPAGPLLVAFSGGLDSSVLLHGLARTAAARTRGLRAVHVDHGIHADSGAWAAHCRRFAGDLGVPLRVCRVEVARDGGEGLEANARRVRHAAIRTSMADGEIAAFAHHRDDQAETVLLKLLRSAGPEGLGGMRDLRRYSPGLAWRPLLELPRRALEAYARRHGLRWIEDPSNADAGIERNFLRKDVMPLLARRWPDAVERFAQSATWMRAAAEYIDAQVEDALPDLVGADPATLDVRRWLALPAALRDPLLRRWLRDLGLPGPSRHQLAELERQLATAAEDRLPCLRWPGVELRRYRGLLYAMVPLLEPPSAWSAPFDGDALALPVELGVLRLVGQGGTPVRLAEPWQAHFRRDGGQLRLDAAGPTRELRKLFQEAGVPPWQRARLPLLSLDGRLLAVGDRWLSAEARQCLDSLGGRLEWSGAPIA
ncbi:MAG: tRNA lysidine(34) synthetase TilS [Xanthomonadales bacterium]|nr:tRNA lysidine(34) synthetase TilS [Xanthomonadales bacterium]